MKTPYKAISFTAATFLGLSGCAGNTVKSYQTAACASTAPTGLPCAHGVPTGLVYALPRGQVLLAAYRKPISASDVSKAQADVATANQQLADAETKLVAAQATQTKNAATAGETAAQKSADQATVTAAQATVSAAQASVQSTTAKLADLKSGLPKPTADDLAQAKQKVDDAQGKVDSANAALAKAKAAGKQPEIDTAQNALTRANKALQDATASEIKVKTDVQSGKNVETVTLTPLPIVPDDTQRFIANLAHSS